MSNRRGFALLSVLILLTVVIAGGVGGYLYVSEKKELPNALPGTSNFSGQSLQGFWRLDRMFAADPQGNFTETSLEAEQKNNFSEFRQGDVCIDGKLSKQNPQLLCGGKRYPYSISGDQITIIREGETNIVASWHIEGDRLEVVMDAGPGNPQKTKSVFVRFTRETAMPKDNGRAPATTEKTKSLTPTAQKSFQEASGTPSPSPLNTFRPKVSTTPVRCGDNICNGEETNYFCSADCNSMTIIELSERILITPPAGTNWQRSFDFSAGEYDLPQPLQGMELLDGREVRFSFYNSSDPKLTLRDAISELLLVFPKERRTQALERVSLLANQPDTVEELADPGIGSASKAFKFTSPDGKIKYVIGFITKGYNIVLSVAGLNFSYEAVRDMAKKSFDNIDTYSSLR